MKRPCAFLSLLLAVLLLHSTTAAQTPQGEAFHAFLQATFASARAEWPDTTYVAAFADLDGDGREEALVSLHSGLFCGSGGCALYIYTPDGAAWRELAELTIVGPRVRLLGSRTDGWRDLSVRVRGGGMDLPREALIRFDGGSYAESPPRADWRPARSAGRLLIRDDAESRRLF